MADNLVIVESPAKAKTIEKFLGKDFVVKSSFGHIRDLSKKNLGVDIEGGFEPDYEVSADKKKVVTELKKAVKSANTVWLASDEDREGEAISWHLYEVLNLKPENTKRIVFHEITKKAIQNAIQTPRNIDFNLVDAQQARRVLDRIVGFELSPVLWKKVKPSLSAGRVQSVAVRIIVEREREIIAFVPESSFRVIGDFKCEHGVFNAELNSRIKKESEIESFLNSCKNADYSVQKIETKPSKRYPAPPFTTSTLQQEASRKLGFSVTRTMSVAQSLYESGRITYMRTDSVNLSETAIDGTKAYILKEYGEEYLHNRNYTSKIKGAQEAHEAIRPTEMGNLHVSDNYDEQRLYELIWKRTIASQMSNAEFEKTSADIAISSSTKYKFIAKGEVLKFEGFLKVYMESSDDENEEKAEEGLLPPLKKNEVVQNNAITATERFSHHPPRYTEASLVKKLEDLGIGRPSTYAPTISTVQKRGYVVKEDRDGSERLYKEYQLKNSTVKSIEKTETTGREKAKLFPTDIGMVVTDFLVDNFEKILDYNFTATVEDEFDNIAAGSMQWKEMLDKFYKSFHPTVENTLENTERNTGERILGEHPTNGKQVSVRIGRYGPMVQLGTGEDEDLQYASLPKGYMLETVSLEDALRVLETSLDGRYIGEDPQTGKSITARIGRYGPFAQLGDGEGVEKPIYASLKKDQSVETLTLEEAIDLFKLPRNLGEFEGKKVNAAVGRFGPYIAHNSTFTSLKKTDDPLEITLERAIELILEKREKDKEKTIKLFSEDPAIKVVYDRWKNPSVYYKRKYFRISKTHDPSSLTLEQCYDIAGVKAPVKAKKGASEKKTPNKDASSKKTSTKQSNTKGKN